MFHWGFLLVLHVFKKENMWPRWFPFLFPGCVTGLSKYFGTFVCDQSYNKINKRRVGDGIGWAPFRQVVWRNSA